VLLFIGILGVSKKYEHEKIITIIEPPLALGENCISNKRLTYNELAIFS
jgi:hypothetical protein